MNGLQPNVGNYSQIWTFQTGSKKYMKSLLRAYTFHLLALLVVDAILGASFQVSGGTQTLLIGAGVLAGLNILL